MENSKASPLCNGTKFKRVIHYNLVVSENLKLAMRVLDQNFWYLTIFSLLSTSVTCGGLHLKRRGSWSALKSQSTILFDEQLKFIVRWCNLIILMFTLGGSAMVYNYLTFLSLLLLLGKKIHKKHSEARDVDDWPVWDIRKHS